MRNFFTSRGLRGGVRNLSLALGALAALCCLSFLGLAKAQTQPVSYSVFPVPGTLTASAKTQITFRGGDAASLGTVTVKGSESGAHAGTLKPHSDGQGASFVPSKPFTENETVTTNKPGTAPGLVFLAPKAGRGQDGPMIIDNKGSLVWFKPMQGEIAADFRVQTYQGKPVLTWWEGALFLGDGDGVGQVLDTNYKPVATVRTGNGYTFDLHEFTITPRNTALVLAYERY